MNDKLKSRSISNVEDNSSFSKSQAISKIIELLSVYQAEVAENKKSVALIKGNSILSEGQQRTYCPAVRMQLEMTH